MAHITGGGIHDNLPRILPSACLATLKKGSWEVPSIFPFLQNKGNISDTEMYRVFNNGIGYVLVVPAPSLEAVLELLEGLGEKAFHIGSIHKREEDYPPVVIE
jgi:phosphoribosylformylglycinamidine cyclo-ligase